MSKIICSPGAYIQGNGLFSELASYYKQVGSSKAYLIVDKFISETYAERIMSSFIQLQVSYEIEVFSGECCMDEINRHKEKLDECDVVLGIGGGKTLDTAKAVAFYAKRPVIIVPTAASTDAPCSRLSVIYTKEGAFENYLPLPSNPTMVIMDTEIIANAPVRFLSAGIGDALATYYEAAACQQSDATTLAGGTSTKTAIALAKLCRDTLLTDGIKALRAVELGVSTKAVENIVEANTYLSGIGFESGGLAAAHAIHNGLTVLEETHHILHGEKVAFGTITQMVLENRSMEEIKEIISFCKACKLPTTLDDLGLADVEKERLFEVAKASCSSNDTMGNMPFVVTVEDVYAAMVTADSLAK